MLFDSCPYCSCFEQCLKSQVNISLLERLYTDKLYNTDTSKWQNLLTYKLKERKKSNLCEKHYGNHSLLTVSVERFREVVPLFALVCDILIFTFHMGCCKCVCWGRGRGGGVPWPRHLQMGKFWKRSVLIIQIVHLIKPSHQATVGSWVEQKLLTFKDNIAIQFGLFVASVGIETLELLGCLTHSKKIIVIDGVWDIGGGLIA